MNADKIVVDEAIDMPNDESLSIVHEAEEIKINASNYVDLTKMDLNDDEMLDKAVNFLIGLESLGKKQNFEDKYTNFASKCIW